MTKSERLRFNIYDDLTLLREVAYKNPYEDYSRWEIILEDVRKSSGKMYSFRTIKEHLEHLLKLWLRRDLSNLRKSGTVVQFDEKQELIQRILQLKRQFRGERAPRKRQKIVINNEEDTESVTFSHHESPLEEACDETKDEIFVEEPILVDTDQEETNLKTEIENPESYSDRSEEELNGSIQLDSVKRRNFKEIRLEERWLDLEERKTALDERKLLFEERKWELEKKERETKLQLELEERRNNLEMSKRHQNIIDFLVQQTKCKEQLT